MTESEKDIITIMECMVNERLKQLQLYPESEDDKKSEDDWLMLIGKYANSSFKTGPEDFRDRMYRVGALAIAALEAWGRRNEVPEDYIEQLEELFADPELWTAFDFERIKSAKTAYCDFNANPLEVWWKLYCEFGASLFDPEEEEDLEDEPPCAVDEQLAWKELFLMQRHLDVYPAFDEFLSGIAGQEVEPVELVNRIKDSVPKTYALFSKQVLGRETSDAGSSSQASGGASQRTEQSRPTGRGPGCPVC